MVVALLAIVLTFILVIGLHEVGHALAARFLGVKIERISLGFGKPLFRWQGKQGYEWVWAIWPLGGYVQLLNTRISPAKKTDYSVCFDKKPIWVRIVILLSGALANLIVAYMALTLFFLLGYQHNIPVVEAVAPNSIAAYAGIKPLDRFTSVASNPLNSWQEVGTHFIVNMGKKKVVAQVVNSDKTVRTIHLDLETIKTSKNKTLFSFLGIKPNLDSQYHERVAGVSFPQALVEAFCKVGQLLGFFLLVLKQLLTGNISFSLLLGPLGLLSVSVFSFNQGVSIFLYFIASFSLAVGLVNLFPIPSLDGGSIIYAVVEKIRGKPASIAFEILLHRLVMIVFVMLFLQLMMNDLQRYLH